MEDAAALLETLDKVEHQWALKSAAVIFSLLEDRESTLEYLGYCLEQALGQCSVASLRLDPWWDYLREDTDFQDLLQSHEGQ